MTKTKKILLTAFAAANVVGGVSAGMRQNAVDNELVNLWEKKNPTPDERDSRNLTALRYGTAVAASLVSPITTFASVAGQITVNGQEVETNAPDALLGKFMGLQKEPSSVVAMPLQILGTLATGVYTVASWPGQLVGTVAAPALNDLRGGP
ncbi:MAG: hypothetical protein KJ667_06875 [Alphaproteobacteria bacterium]|nr:hypothetical protein [Alphaproteobacteria bacterium]